jgi:hypothetical protein
MDKCGVLQMNTNKRGVKLVRVSTENYMEVPSTCKCHVFPGIRHAMACCNQPKTEAGMAALVAYEEENKAS